MSVYVINGGHRLLGETAVQGAKNSALPILAASLLCHGKTEIHNCPDLSDVDATVNILRHLGCEVQRYGSSVVVDAENARLNEIPDSLMREMRSSVIFLGAILARMGNVSLSTPGGCEIGLRPIDLHLDAMKKLGAKVSDEFGHINCECKEKLKGAKISLSFPSVGATENIMIAASTAQGTTTIVNAAREPEISDLADFLNNCGARISGAGEGIITVEGVKKLTGAVHTVIPDRIVAATVMAGAAMTHGRVKLKNIIPAHLGPVIDVFEEAGCRVEADGRSVMIEAPSKLKAIKTIRTMPYPGFPTDIQAPVVAMLSVAQGTSVVIETIFESRYKYIGELSRLGAKVRVDGRMAVIEGVNELHGVPVITPDLRGGAALVLAGLAAKGTTEISQIKHIDRGYEKLEQIFSSLSADIKRVEENEQNQTD